MGYNVINKMLAMLGEEKVKPCSYFLDCQVCKNEKPKAYLVAKESGRVSTRPLALVHMDVISPYPNSHSGKRYAIIIMDDHTLFMWVFL